MPLLGCASSHALFSNKTCIKFYSEKNVLVDQVQNKGLIQEHTASEMLMKASWRLMAFLLIILQSR